MDNKKMTVEEANELIEQNISKLENETLPLKETVEIYTKTCELIEYSLKELNEYQGKITEINDRLAQLGAEGIGDAALLDGEDIYEE